MKQLKKLKLNEFHEMTDNEMKFIVGGSGGSGSGDSGSGDSVDSCTKASAEGPLTCNGDCPPITGIKEGKWYSTPQTCTDTSYSSNGKILYSCGCE
ncbi:TIGR04149 family rSAM-modified RiPP [Bacteroidales bacterium OttesenSCG-928-A17]|nr:TIGR04149 family rSAM-modified RiPP [Bacteroidales bacterium OttesenSCG-928-A17]